MRLGKFTGRQRRMPRTPAVASLLPQLLGANIDRHLSSRIPGVEDRVEHDGSFLNRIEVHPRPSERVLPGRRHDVVLEVDGKELLIEDEQIESARLKFDWDDANVSDGKGG